MPEIIAIARRIAANAPEATLACPICGIALRAANLDRHLCKIHPGQDDAGTSWHGGLSRGGRLSWVDGELCWRSRFGLRQRTVSQVRSVTVGSTAVSWLGASRDYGTSSGRSPSAPEKPGHYVEVRGDGPTITIRCRAGGGVRKAWIDWAPGPQVKSWQITVGPDAFVALLYLLTEAEVLRPKGE